MLHKILFAIALMATITSCQQIDSDQLSTTSTESTKQTKNVQFVMKGITEEYSTRATVQSAGCTDLWIWEGTTLLKHQVSTDDDFGTPTVSLTYGSHDLTFVASSSKEQSWTDGVWSTSKVVDDYAVQMNVTVSGSSSTSRQVQLTRRNSRVTFITTDNVPATVSKCHLKVQNHLSLNADLTATNEQYRDVTLDISAYQGKTYTVFMNVLTASPTDEEDCDVTIEFLDASSNVLYHYERTINLKANRNTNLTGKYFSGSEAEISLATEWLTALDTDL